MFSLPLSFSVFPERWCRASGSLAIAGMMTMLTGVGIPVNAKPTTFEDIRGHWAQLCIEDLAKENLVSAFQDANFRPDAPLTRKLYADILSRAFPNVPEAQPNPVFLDLDPSDQQFEKVYQTARQGFFVGVSNQRFEPNRPISREAFFVALANGLNYETSSSVLEILTATYDDSFQIAPFAQFAVAAATERNIVVDYPDLRNFRPQDAMTRAEAAAIFCQIRQSDRSQSFVPPQHAVELPTLPTQRSLVRVMPTQSDEVMAELTYDKENYTYRNLQLTLTRHNQIKLRQDIPLDGGFIRNLGLQVIDLDGEAEPEIILSFFAGAQRCCSYSLIYSYIPRRDEYGITQQSWGYEDYTLVDLDQNGLPELQSRDPRFTIRFADSIQDGIAPLQIWQYRQGRLFDVTRLFPSFVEVDAENLWGIYQARLQRSPDYQSPSLKPVLAAYTANQLILGGDFESHRYAESGYGGPDRSQYLKELREFLRGTGYTNH